MQALFILLACAVLGQTPQLPPEGSTTYRIEFDNGSVVFGTLQPVGSAQVEVVYDTPWDPRPPLRTLASKVVSNTVEPKSAREARIAQGWKDAGYVAVETPSGTRWARAEEVQLAERARAMAREVQERNEARPLSTASPSDAQAASPAAPASSGNPWTSRLPQAGLGLGAILLSAIILRYLILR